MKIPNIEFIEKKLPNGIKLILVPRNWPKFNYLFMRYSVGSKDEMDGERGVSHLLEHLMFKGTKHYPPQYLSNFLSTVGGENNAFTGWDSTCFYSIFPHEHLKKILEFEKDRMLNLDFKEFKQELDVVRQERHLSVENNPTGVFNETLFLLAFLYHPYRYPILGTFSDLDSMNREKVYNYYNSMYIPQRLNIIVGGFIDKNTEKIVEDTFGDVKKAGSARIAYTFEPEQNGLRRFTQKGDIKNSIITVMLKAPPFSHRDIPTLELASSILGDGRASFLYRELISKRNLFSVIKSVLYPAKDATLLAITGIVNYGKSLVKAEKMLLKFIFEKRNAGFSEKALKTVKRLTIAESIYKMENIQDLSMTIGDLSVISRASDITDIPKRQLKAELSDIKEVSDKYIQEPKATVGILYSDD